MYTLYFAINIGGPTIFDDRHRPTILGSNEAPSEIIINLTFVDTNEEYNNIRSVLIII